MITYNAPITGGTKDFNYKLIDCEGEISISFDVSYLPQPELPWVNVTSSDTKISISFGATEETEERTATITPKVNGESCDSQAITIIQASHCNCDIISSVAITERIPSAPALAASTDRSIAVFVQFDPAPAITGTLLFT
jgi:hypothetical protein